MRGIFYFEFGVRDDGCGEWQGCGKEGYHGRVEESTDDRWWKGRCWRAKAEFVNRIHRSQKIWRREAEITSYLI